MLTPVEDPLSGKYTVFGVVTALSVIIDQATKYWVNQNIQVWKGSIPVIPGLFELVNYKNKGAAFGMGTGWGSAMLVFAIFTVIALGVMGWMLVKLPKEDRFEAGIMGLITGGAIGNAIDRAMYQEVTDFLKFFTDDPDQVAWLNAKFGMAEWPSFNVADSCIVVGVLVFFVYTLIQDYNDKGKPDKLADDGPLPELDQAIE